MSESGLSFCVVVVDVVAIVMLDKFIGSYSGLLKGADLTPFVPSDLGFDEEKMNTRASRRTRPDNCPVDVRPDWLRLSETVAVRARSSACIAVVKAVMRLRFNFAGMYDNLNADSSAWKQFDRVHTRMLIMECVCPLSLAVACAWKEASYGICACRR